MRDIGFVAVADTAGVQGAGTFQTFADSSRRNQSSMGQGPRVAERRISEHHQPLEFAFRLRL
jgi:hypothetical protein